MTSVVLDFETKDPYIQRGLGPGWSYAINYPNKHDFKPLGAAVLYENGQSKYITDWVELCDELDKVDGLIMHNALYDYGILLYLYNTLKRPFGTWVIYDTMIMAKLVDCTKKSYSLSNLAKAYRLSQKETSLLSDYVYDSGLYHEIKKERTGKEFTKKPQEKILLKMAYENLDLVDEAIVAEYAMVDAKVTYELYLRLVQDLHYLDLTLYSDIVKVCTDIRLQGIRVDLEKVRILILELDSDLSIKQQELYDICGLNFNINSPQQCVEALEKAKVTGFPISPVTGNKSVAKMWLESQQHPACKLLVEVRKLTKLRNDFLQSILDSQEYTDNDGKTGRIFSTLNPLGAAATGRFSSSNINIQQIPKRDAKWGKLIRSVFLPEPGHYWTSCDFSNQEQRLQVQDAATFQCQGGKEMLIKWQSNPDMDYHQAVADLANIDRDSAKTINLGLSYGMGEMKLCKQLNLPTEFKRLFLDGRYKTVEVAGIKGKQLIQSYHEMVPYVKALNNLWQDLMQENGYISTIGGRRLNHGGFQDNIRKALNKRIQGNAADQILKALVLAWKTGLHILCSVHDEINISSTGALDDQKLEICMKQAYNLDIPMIIDTEKGENWGMVHDEV